MELLPLARRLRHRWRLLLAGVAVAIAVAFAVGSPQASPGSALASTQVALDTPASQLVAAAPAGADTLPWRASLLAHLMTTDAARDELARRVGQRPEDVAVVDPVLATPQIQASMPRKAAEAAAVTVAPYVLTVEVRNPLLPVLSIEAAAPDQHGARGLAEAAVAVLEAETSPGGGYQSLVPAKGAPGRRLQAFVVEEVAQVRVEPVPADTMPARALGVAAIMLLGWTSLVLLAPRRARKPPAHRAAAST